MGRGEGVGEGGVGGGVGVGAAGEGGLWINPLARYRIQGSIDPHCLSLSLLREVWRGRKRLVVLERPPNDQWPPECVWGIVGWELNV
jgi:hypothetical protein